MVGVLVVEIGGTDDGVDGTAGAFDSGDDGTARAGLDGDTALACFWSTLLLDLVGLVGVPIETTFVSTSAGWWSIAQVASWDYSIDT